MRARPSIGDDSADAVVIAFNALESAERNLQAAKQALDTFRESGDEQPTGLTQLLLTVPQVCRLLGYRKTKIYYMMKNGVLPYVIDRGHRRIEYRSLLSLIKDLRSRKGRRAS